jgi:hypothetical protein
MKTESGGMAAAVGAGAVGGQQSPIRRSPVLRSRISNLEFEIVSNGSLRPSPAFRRLSAGAKAVKLCVSVFAGIFLEIFLEDL